MHGRKDDERWHKDEKIWSKTDLRKDVKTPKYLRKDGERWRMALTRQYGGLFSGRSGDFTGGAA